MLGVSPAGYKSRRPWWNAPPLRTGVSQVFFSEICVMGLLRANPSMPLARVQVREIVLKSVWISCGGETLGRGLIMDRFNRSGTYPSLSEQL